MTVTCLPCPKSLQLLYAHAGSSFSDIKILNKLRERNCRFTVPTTFTHEF